MPTPSGPAGSAGTPAAVFAAGELSPELADAALELAGEAAAADGVSPLSEHAMLNLRRGTEDQDLVSLVLYRDGVMAGYAQLERAGSGEATGELVIRPADRRAGLGRELLRALSGAAGGTVSVWAHGDSPAAAALAASAGFERTRALWQLRLAPGAELAAPRIPDGITLRPFRPGQDEEAWLQVNARAFASHPEQGAWTRSDLELREAEPWFDPDGFFLAERAGRLAGFHWTKVHAAAGLGEVYVVGVDPAEQGTGLGRALTLTGLHYLRGLGLAGIMLYAEETNTAAIGLYRSLGFSQVAADVVYTGRAVS